MRRLRYVACLAVCAGVGAAGGHFIVRDLVGSAAAPPAVSVSISAQQRAVGDRVVQIVNRSDTCRYEALGTGWPVADQYVATNAHVVSGQTTLKVKVPGGGELPAIPVLFDPNTDLAVLYVPGLHLQPLTLSSSDPAAGTSVADIGYALGGPEKIVGGVVNDVESTAGLGDQNIYKSQSVTRTVDVLTSTHIVPGDSGGPIVDRNGTVVGVAYASVVDHPSIGLALAPSQVRGLIAGAIGKTTPVATSYDGQSCISG